MLCSKLVLRCSLLSMCFTLVFLPVSNAQSTSKSNTTAAKPKAAYWFCWTAQFRTDQNGNQNHYFSDVFYGPYTRSELDAAFTKYAQKTYHNDFVATGIGPANCKSYSSKEAADSQKNTDETERQNEGATFHPPYNSQVVETGWSYGGKATAEAPTKYMYCLSSNCITERLFETSRDEASVAKEFGRWLTTHSIPRTWVPRGGSCSLDVACKSFDTAEAGIAAFQEDEVEKKLARTDDWEPAARK